MTTEEESILSRVGCSIEQLLKQDAYLLETDLAERTICGRLAMYLQQHFPDFDVDVEYNRNGDEGKRLEGVKDYVRISREQGVLRAHEEEFGVSVSPDIIIHKRGADGPNLVVIEVKKEGNPVDGEYDDLKIRAYRRELGYQVGIFIFFEIGEDAGEYTMTPYLD